MNDLERRKLDAFKRVEAFGATHSSDFAANSPGKLLFDELAEIVDKLTNLTSSESTGQRSVREKTVTRSEARSNLRADLRAMARASRAMSDEETGIPDKFRVPRNSSDEHLLATARSFAADAVPFSAQFIAHELPANFLEVLNQHIEELEAAIAGQTSGVGHHVNARAEIRETADEGAAVIRKLRMIMKNKYAGRPGILAEWRSASHLERGRHRTLSEDAGGGPSLTNPGPGTNSTQNA